jgi:hypothetical protein
MILSLCPFYFYYFIPCPLLHSRTFKNATFARSAKFCFSASSRQLPLACKGSMPLRGNFYSYFALARSRATARENKQNNKNEARAKVKSLYLFEVAGAKE